MRTRLSAKIDSVNNEFHCPLTPRNDKGEIINCHECSAQQLFHVVSQFVPPPSSPSTPLFFLTMLCPSPPPSFSPPPSQHQDRKAEMDLGVTQTGALQRRATRSSSIHNHHLYLVVNKIDHQFPEEVEIFFFLFNTEEKGQQVSERYLVKSNRSHVHNRSHDDKQSALFTVSILI